MQPPALAPVLHPYSAVRRCDTDENRTESHTRFGPGQRRTRRPARTTSSTRTSTANPQSTSHDPLSAASTAAKANRAALLSSYSWTRRSLFVTQRDDGIDAHGTPRRNVRGQ